MKPVLVWLVLDQKHFHTEGWITGKMSDKPAQKLSESDDFTDNSVDNANDGTREDTSQQSGLATVESEYDTASDSPSDGEEYDEQEDETDSGEEEEMGSDADDDEEDDPNDGSDDDVIEVLDYERQSGDGQEQETDSKRKVDDDEDRSNPQYIPKKGTFYEHDDRTVEDDDVKDGDEVNSKNDESNVSVDRKGVDKNAALKPVKKWQASADRWTHDRFDESEQAPKSRAELVSAYGYDIRSEDGPPRARRRRRYARGPNKYTRNWEDEDAYTKSSNVEHNRQRKVPRPEEFPELGTNSSKSRTQNPRRVSKQTRSSVGERLDERSGRQRSERRTSDRNRVSNTSRSGGIDRDRGMDRDRGDRYEQRAERERGDRLDRERERERNWERDRDYDSHEAVNYRDNRADGSRYSAERVTNNGSYHNKENKLNNRSSKEKDRRGSDYKVITSLQFKNQTRNKNVEAGMGNNTGGGSGVPQVVHSGSSGALSGSSNSNKMNNALERVQPVPERIIDQRSVQQHHYQNQQPQLIPQQPPPQVPQQQQPLPQQLQHQQQIPPPQAPVQQQSQPPPQPIQTAAPYVNDDHYDAYSESKMKDAKFPYNPPANSTIQSVEIGQTDIAKYPPTSAQRVSKDRQQVLTSTVSTRSQISPRQIVSTQASQLTSITTSQSLSHQQQIQQQTQQQQYQQQLQQQAQYQLQHTLANQTVPPNTTQPPPTQVPPPQLPNQQPPAQLSQPHNVHLSSTLANTAVSQQQLIPSDSSSRSSKRYSSLRQRSTIDNPNVVVVQSPLHEQQQQQLLQQQQQQQLLLQQELQHQQQQKLNPPTPKPNYQLSQPPQTPALPLNLQNEYLVQSANQTPAATKSQSASQAPVQYQHPAAYYTASNPAGSEFVTNTTTQPVPVQQPPAVASVPVPVVPQQQNPLLTAPQYPQYTQPSSGQPHQYIQAPPPTAYITQPNTTPQPQAPQATPAAPPPQIMNYVPSINPAAPTQYPTTPYTGYQNYNAVVPQPVAPTVPITPSPSAATAALYQSSGGITYYAPQSQTQTPRPLPSQRRPTSAIPILAPPDRKAKGNRVAGDISNINDNEENNVISSSAVAGTTITTSGANAPIGSAENIDHILDNMFEQRRPYQPPTRKSPSPAPTSAPAMNTMPSSAAAPISGAGVGTNKIDGTAVDPTKDTDKESMEKIGDSVKKLTIQEEKRPLVDPLAGEKLDIAPAVASVDPTAG